MNEEILKTVIKNLESEGKSILYCDHIADALNDVYLFAYLGENTRLAICRLCSTMILGTIVSSRIKEIFPGVEESK